MARPTTSDGRRAVLQIFVAYPSDVHADKAALQEVVDEFNQVWSRFLALFVELVAWDSHARPGVGPYPQSVINSQLGSDYAALIAIFGGRIGTPTPVAPSGAAEEVERAIKLRAARRDNWPEVLVYFRSQASELPEAEREQACRLLEFRHDLRSRGILDWDVRDTSDFKAQVRRHVALLVQRWIAERGAQNVADGEAGTTRPRIQAGALVLDAYLPLLDEVDAERTLLLANTHGRDLRIAITLSSEATRRFGDAQYAAAEKLRVIKADAKSPDEMRARVADVIESSLEALDRWRIVTSGLRVELRRAFGGLVGATIRNHELSNTELPARSMRSLADQLGETAKSIHLFCDSLYQALTPAYSAAESRARSVGLMVESDVLEFRDALNSVASPGGPSA